MSEASGNGEQEGSHYIRLPWPLVAGGLLVFLALVFAAGLYANRNLRPQGRVVATPVVAAVPTGTAAPQLDLTTATPRPIAVALIPALATATAVAAPTATSVVPTPVSVASTAESVPTARPTVSPELATTVGDAYKQYWNVRAEALYELDDSRLEQVMAGEHLAAVQDRISELRAEGHAIQTDVDHTYVVVEASEDTATVVDKYIDQSVYVDSQTHNPISSPTGQTMIEQYSFAKIGGFWRVVSLVRSP